MGKKNCWEAKNCQRQPGGSKVSALGACRAAVETKTNGLHGGLNGGRVCWAIAGTLCGGEVQGEYAKKIQRCSDCAFYQQVRDEEGRDYLLVMKIFEKLK